MDKSNNSIKSSNDDHPRLIQSIVRATKLLELIAQSENGVPLKNIAEYANLAPSTAHRILATLLTLGYVSQIQSRKEYYLGLKLLNLGEISKIHSGYTLKTNSELQHLSDITKELVNFVILSGTEVVYIAQKQATDSHVRFFTQLGARAPLHCTAVGKAILSLKPASYINQVITNGLSVYTPNTIIHKCVMLSF